jgi:hypothetical protein
MPRYNAEQIERRKRYAELDHMPWALNPNQPFPDDWADYVRLAVCDEHGLEAVTNQRQYNTGYDTGIAGEFACGAIVMEDVF